MKKKVRPQYPKHLNDQIVIPDKQSDPYHLPFVQKTLRVNLIALFEHFRIKHGQDISQFPDKLICPQIAPQSQAARGADSASPNPFFDLAIALAFNHVPCFKIATKGAPKKEKYSEQNMRALASYIEEQQSKKLSASTAIGNACSKKVGKLGSIENPFYGTKKTTLEKRWKIFKSTEIQIDDFTWGDVFGIKTSDKKRKQAAKKRAAKPR